MRRSRSDSVDIVWVDGYGSNDKRSERMIHGIASTPTISSNNQALLTRGCEIRVPVPLMIDHKERSVIGEVVYICKQPTQIYVRAIIFDHEAGRYAWQLIERGEFSALSVGSEQGRCNHIQAEVDGTQFYDKWQIEEVSICRKGANPDCSFKIYTPHREHHELVPEMKVEVGLSSEERKRFDDWYNSRSSDDGYATSRHLSLADRKHLALKCEEEEWQLKQKIAKLNKEIAELKKEEE